MMRLLHKESLMLKLVDLLTEKKLRVFDFDDTLVKSNSKVYVINKVKKKFWLTVW